MKSDIVSSALLGKYYREVRLGKFRFKIYMPTLKRIASIVVNECGLNDGIKTICLDHTHSVDKLSIAIFDNHLLRFLFKWYVCRYVPSSHVKEAVEVLCSLMRGDDLFSSVKFEKTTVKEHYDTVGNNSILGVLATLMDSLHVSYTEAFEKIPYPVLLVMSADKIRTLSSNECKVVEMTGREMLNRKIKK